MQCLSFYNPVQLFHRLCILNSISFLYTLCSLLLFCLSSVHSLLITTLTRDIRPPPLSQSPIPSPHPDPGLHSKTLQCTQSTSFISHTQCSSVVMRQYFMVLQPEREYHSFLSPTRPLSLFLSISLV